MSSLIPFEFETLPVRAIKDDSGEPWFVAADVCAALGIGNVTQALSRLDLDEVSLYSNEGQGFQQAATMNIINESGLYSLTLTSRKPEAKRFKKWVTAEVLPSIRKTGSYSIEKPQAELSRLQIIQLAMDAEQGRLKAEAERDVAIATKAEIGSRREATAMATAAAAKRESKILREELGFNEKYATVKAVEKVGGFDFAKKWRDLKAWCAANGESPRSVPDKQYGEVKAWPAGAWKAAFGVDLPSLFGANGPKAAH